MSLRMKYPGSSLGSGSTTSPTISRTVNTRQHLDTDIHRSCKWSCKDPKNCLSVVFT